MNNLLTIIFLVTILGCTRTRDSNLKTLASVETLSISDKAMLDSLDINLIKYDTSYDYIFPVTFKATDISDKEIFECETLLKSVILDYTVEEMTKDDPKTRFHTEEFKRKLNKYGRQYMTVVSDKGDKIVYINCFCNPTHFDYRGKELIQVVDGGSCFLILRLI
jgi:hypothetical protein